MFTRTLSPTLYSRGGSDFLGIGHGHCISRRPRLARFEQTDPSRFREIALRRCCGRGFRCVADQNLTPPARSRALTSVTFWQAGTPDVEAKAFEMTAEKRRFQSKLPPLPYFLGLVWPLAELKGAVPHIARDATAPVSL